MFDERKIICGHLLLFSVLPFLESYKEYKLIILWLIISCLFFIFPFLSTTIEDNIKLM